MAGFGCFMGAIINANIFGELALILSGINKSDKIYQSKVARMNTAMINIDLPILIRQRIRDELMKN